jgi:hypothetical protein
MKPKRSVQRKCSGVVLPDFDLQRLAATQVALGHQLAKQAATHPEAPMARFDIQIVNVAAQT